MLTYCLYIYVGYRMIIKGWAAIAGKTSSNAHFVFAELATQPIGGLWRGTAVAAAGVESQTGAELHS